jgi:hypothetical protein
MEFAPVPNFFLCYNLYSCIQVFIRLTVGVPGLKKVLILLCVLLPVALSLSCGYTAPPSSGQTSGLKFRAFFTNSVSSSTGVAGVYIVNAATDVRATTAPISAGNTPGMMVVTPSRAQTIVFSGTGTQFSDNQITLINNASETAATTGHFAGGTESIVVSPDNSVAYAAVPTAPVVGQSPGVVEVLSLATGTVAAQITCPPINPNPPNPPPPPVCVTAGGVGDQGINPPYHFLSIGNTGTRLLGFSQGADAVANMVAVITPTSVGTANPVITFVPGFDHPVWAFFNSDDTTAYVLNCGGECGGTQASIQTLDLTTNTAGPVFPMCVGAGAARQCAGTAALVVGSTIYVAGTPFAGGSPSQTCPAGTTLAVNCGLLFTFDLPTMTVTNSVIITDGYHTRLSMAANGQLFVGARTCTEIIPPLPPPPGAEIRGCLSIYNTLSTAVGANPAGGVLIPPANGDVTGIQPISTRTVSYVVQGGSVGVYDMTTDAINTTEQQKLSNLIGVFIDVKTVDF